MEHLGQKARRISEEHTKRTAANDIKKGIHKWLSGDPGTAAKRWAFELLQNALDAAKKMERKLEIEIESADNRDSLVFRHNAGPFTIEEVDAIIYGGTTKIRPFSGVSRPTGKFGSGLFVTHILSRKLGVNGMIEDNGQYFDFELSIDRTSDDVEQLVKTIDACFDELDKVTSASSGAAYYTEFIYEIIGSSAKNAARVGIETLRNWLPFLFAFNAELSAVTIDGQTFVRKEEPEADEKFTRVSVVSKAQDGSEDLQVLRLCDKDHNVTVAVVVRGEEVMAVPADVPRIFVSMPLIGTERIPLPFVIDSSLLEPEEDRNAVYLSGEFAQKNSKLLEQSLADFFDLVTLCVDKKLKGLHWLCSFKKVPMEYFSDKREYWEYWDNTIKKAVNEFTNLGVVDTEEGYIAPSETVFLIPAIGDIESSKTLSKDQFDLFYALAQELKSPIPTADTAYHWQEIAKIWKTIDDDLEIYFCSVESLLDDIKSACKAERDWYNISQVAVKFGLEEQPFFEILYRLFELVNQLFREQKIIESFVDGLLLDQNNTFGPKSGFTVKDVKNEGIQQELFLESSGTGGDIPDELKDLSVDIAFDIRSCLLDNRFSGFAIVRELLQREMDVNTFIKEMMRYRLSPQEKVKLEENRFVGWVRLLTWCIQNGKISQDMPIFARDGTVRLVNPGAPEPILLLPFKHLKIDEKYEHLIPEGRLLHDEYFKLAQDETSLIKRLVENNICFGNVVYQKTQLGMSKEKLKKILVDKTSELTRKEHLISVEDGTISAIPFWSPEILGRICQVGERARSFVHFLAEIIGTRDKGWRTPIEAYCSSCGGKHVIFAAEWLADVACDSWIPVEKGEEGETAPREATKENIENLLGTEDINTIIQSDIGVELLSNLGFDKLDLKIRRKSLGSSTDEQQLREDVAQAVDRDDILALVKYPPETISSLVSQLDEREANRRRMLEGQQSGRVCEEVIREIFADLKKKRLIKAKIVTTHVGADIEIWPEEDGWDGGRINIAPYDIEIKFTTGTRVWFSKAQANRAQETGAKYFIMVIGGDQTLKERLLAYFHLGPREKKKIRALVQQSSHLVPNISDKLVSAPSLEEVEPAIAGYWVKEVLWSRGRDLGTWILEQNLWRRS